MKLRYTMFVLLGILLSGTLFNAGRVVAQGTGPNTNFETGDNFYFNSTETRDDSWLQRIVLANDADASQLYRYQEYFNGNDENTEGDLDLFLVKPGDNLPVFTIPDGGGDGDHLLLVNWEGTTVTPSTRTTWENFFDGGDPACSGWCNSTASVEDTSGRYYSSDNNNDDENAMPLVSNATYLIQMSEMLDDFIYFDQLKWMQPEMDLGTFDGNIPLISRSVNDETAVKFNINGADKFLNTKYSVSNFAISWTEAFGAATTFGDPNAPLIDVNATVDIIVNYDFEYRFDQANGMLLEIIEDKSYSMNILYSNSSMDNPNWNPTDGGPETFAFEMYTSIIGSSRNHMTIQEASSFYGNTRAASSGANRIEQGDLLVYDSESSNEFSFDSDMVVGDSSTTGWENYDSKWGYSDGYGTVNFDVYRHQPGSFDTVMFMEGTSNGEWGYDNSGTHQGQYRSDSNTSTWGPENYLDYDYMSFMSSADEEIIHFFDENMNFDDDFLYDDNDNGDGWRLNYNRDVPQSGVVNDTAFHADLSSDEIFQINGFDRTWFDVQMYGQNYERTYNEVVEIPVFRDDNGEAWMNVTLTGIAEGSQEFFYDSNTGVLLRMEQRTNVYLTLDGNQLITFDVFEEGKEPATITVTADFFASITISEKFSIMLNEHPVEYLTAESTDPIDHVTDTSTSTTTTVDTITSSSTTTSDDGGNGADLPLPVPIVPVLSALTVVAIYVRKRKY